MLFVQSLTLIYFGEVFLGWVDKNTFAPSTEGDGIAVAVKKYSQGLPEWKVS